MHGRTLLGMVAALAAAGCAEIAGINEPTPRGGGGSGGGADACEQNAGCVPVMLSAGGYHGCAVFEDGGLKCWGRNDYGQLGLGDQANRGDDPGEMGEALPWVTVDEEQKVLAISAGGSHTCAVTSAHEIKCWGHNADGRLGLGNTAARGGADTPRALPALSLGSGAKAIGVAAGDFHSCALLEGGAVKCWGSNESGQLGLGDAADRGSAPLDMGDALPAVDLGAGKEAVSIAVGSRHSCALLAGGAVKCWGHNADGRLGLGDTANRGMSGADMGDGLAAVNLGVGLFAQAIAAGRAHTCALLDNGLVKCWGHGASGQLGAGSELDRGGAPGDMGDALPAVDLGGRTATAIAAGGDHTCALLGDGAAVCWGDNTHGQLGLGTTTNAGGVPGDLAGTAGADLGAPSEAKELVAGAEYTCALFADGAVKCWGDGLHGQLGGGSRLDVGDEAGEMGAALAPVPLLLAP